MIKGLKKVAALVGEVALDYPEAWLDHPWGQDTYKVRKKAFVFTGGEDGYLTVSLKLPFARDEVLLHPFASPTGYGLGKSGWVTLTIDEETSLDPSDLEEWIDESYRAVAPKTLVKTLPPLAP